MPIFNKIVSRKMELENGLRRALLNDEFVLYYQPQIELKTRKIRGLEALIRWNHPKLGIIPPNEFIRIAEETGLVNSIGEWVLRTACKQNKKWQEAGYSDLIISVNVSGVQFKRMSFIDKIKSVLEETGLAPHFLEIEITESVFHEITEMRGKVQELTSLGIKMPLMILDGYSSISLLKYLTMDSLKLDRLLTQDILINPNALVLLKSIIEMGHNLNLIIIAEGIEDEQQINVLQQYNADLVQGYFFSRPEPAENIEILLKESQQKAY